tara:strand:- start:3078 stop:3329 length:252 start_codon:yes stop_codon:yes gene_type:complete
MKYQAEREAVELGLLDIGDLVAENIDRLDFAQQQDIQHRVELIRLLLKRNLPLKAKQQLKYLDKYIQQSLYDYQYCPSLYLDW